MTLPRMTIRRLMAIILALAICLAVPWAVVVLSMLTGAVLAIRRLARASPLAVYLSLLAASLGLWAWTEKVYYRPLEPPIVGVRAFGTLAQVGARQGAVHLLCMKDGPFDNLSLQWGRASSMGIGAAHRGAIVDGLGVALVLLPVGIRDSDVDVGPHAAIILPCWLLATIFAGLAGHQLLLRARRPRKYGRVDPGPPPPPRSDRRKAMGKP